MKDGRRVRLSDNVKKVVMRSVAVSESLPKTLIILIILV